MDPEFDEIEDQRISNLYGQDSASPDEDPWDPSTEFQSLSLEISRVFLEESPRISTLAQSRHLAELKMRAGSKRSESRFKNGWFLRWAPRALQIAALAVILVFIANGITVVSASSLPGSPLYSVKRWTEQSEVIFAPTAGGRARIWMALAGRRLDEVQRLLEIQPQVASESLDDIDESILQALTETAGTRGQERIELLEQLIKLAFREQTVLDELAPKASSDDRARLQQTSHLMSDVANIASSAQSNLGVPMLVPSTTSTKTASSTATESPTATGTYTLTPTSTPEAPITVAPSVTPTNQSDDSQPTQVAPPTTTGQKSPHQGGGPVAQPSDAPVQNKPATPGGGGDENPTPSDPVTPERHKTEYPTPPKEGTPDVQDHPATPVQDSSPESRIIPVARFGLTFHDSPSSETPRTNSERLTPSTSPKVMLKPGRRD